MRLAEAAMLTFAALLFAYLCLNQFSAARNGSAFVPMEYDTFYHAVRISEFQTTGSLIQFDPKLNAPYGSFVPWPWLYDYLLATAEKLGRSAGVEPFAIPTFAPPVLGALNLVLMYLIGRRLRLSLSAIVFVMLGFATSCGLQVTHLVGRYDHHAAELTVFLGALWLALTAIEKNQVRYWALWGGCLALAMGIHNGLFVLQVPLVVHALLQGAIKRQPLPRAQAVVACLALFGGILLLLAGSTAFREGVFAFYHLSWFHLLVSAMTCGAVVASTVRLSPRQWVIAAVALLVPAAFAGLLQLQSGLQWLSADMTGLERVSETRALAKVVREQGVWHLLQYYGLWILALPIASLFAIRRPVPFGMTVLWSQLALGLLLGLYQFRYIYFGVPASLLICGLALSRLERPRLLVQILAITMITATSFAVASERLLGVYPEAIGNRFYFTARAFSPVLQEACANRPGAILAHKDYGHYLRFFSECAVIADNFIVTPEDQERIAFSRALLNGSSEKVLKHPWIRYVIVDVTSTDATGLNSMMMSDAVQDSRFRVIAQASAGNQVVARLLEIDHH